MQRRCRRSFHVSVVVAAILYIYFSTVFVFIDQWFGLGTSPGLLNAVVFTGLAIMSISTYALAILTDPGRIPASFAPDIENSDNTIHEIKRKVLFFSINYCFVTTRDSSSFVPSARRFCEMEPILHLGTCWWFLDEIFHECGLKPK